MSTSVFSAPTIHGATLPGNREKPNEDAWGFTLDCAWVLDGATLAEYPPNERTLVSDFVSCVNDEIRAAVGSDFDAPLRDLVAEAMASPAVKRFAAHEVEVSATLAMARVRASGVEWLLLGDAGILVPSASGIDFHTDDRLARVASRQRATLRRYRREPSHDGPSSAPPRQSSPGKRADTGIGKEASGFFPTTHRPRPMRARGQPRMAARSCSELMDCSMPSSRSHRFCSRARFIENSPKAKTSISNSTRSRTSWLTATTERLTTSPPWRSRPPNTTAPP